LGVLDVYIGVNQIGILFKRTLILFSSTTSLVLSSKRLEFDIDETLEGNNEDERGSDDEEGGGGPNIDDDNDIGWKGGKGVLVLCFAKSASSFGTSAIKLNL